MDKSLQQQMFRAVWVVIILLLIVGAVYYVTPLIYPFLIGWIVAYILNPLVQVLQSSVKLPRWLAVILSLLLFVGTASLFIALMITKIIDQINNLAQYIDANISGWTNDIIDYVNSNRLQNIMSQINRFYEQNENIHGTIADNLSSVGQKAAQSVSSLIQYIITGFFSFITLLPSIATVMIIAMLAAFFISKDWYRINRWIVSLFPKKTQSSSRAVWADLQKALFGYVRAQLILISVTATFVIAGLFLLRVKYAIAIGLLTGFVDLLPYLGTGAVMVPWIIYAFIKGDVSLGIGLGILYGIILIARQLIEPKVLATSIGLEPLPTLIAMFIGLHLFGVLGLIIGPVTLVLLSAFYRAGLFRDIRRYIIFGKKP